MSPPAITTDDPLLTVEEVAAYLRMKPATIRAKARRGDLPGIKVGGDHRSRWLFKRSRILELTEPLPAPNAGEGDTK
jgi:excisionase family DNA binding protein